jgi:hypothetical protein
MQCAQSEPRSERVTVSLTREEYDALMAIRREQDRTASEAVGAALLQSAWRRQSRMVRVEKGLAE